MAMSSDGGQYVIERVEAQRSATLVQVAALVGAGVCVALAARLQAPINEQRRELELVMQSDIYKELPPEYAWASAFGAAFRGIAVDFLWIRADNLKEEGKYYESHQLAKWICTLQPRFAQVWSFQAWNMSYNISVATYTPQERWQWVYNGIRLLRDQGIPNNERVVPLYHQLAWTWFHKVGQRLDDYHHYYKRMWAATMQTLLGEPPVGASPAEEIAWFKHVADAPRTLTELTANHPGVNALVQALRELGINVEADANSQQVFHPLELVFFRPYTDYLAEQSLAPLRSKPLVLDDHKQKLFAFFAQAPPEDFQALLAYLRSRVLREQYKMDPAFMLELTGTFGTKEAIPIDWRTPWSQSLYWSAYGVKQGEKAKNLKQFDRINTDRIQLYSLATLAKTGQFMLRINVDEPMKSFLTMGPDFRYIEAMHEKYLELGQKHADEDEDVENRTSDMLRSGHVNNLETAIAALYYAGREDEARKYLQYLAEYYPNRETGELNTDYLKTVEEFVYGQWEDLAGLYDETVRIIHMILEYGYVAMANGQDADYRKAIRRAKTIHDRYQTDAETPQGRLELLTFDQMRSDALYRFVVAGVAYPIGIRSRIWLTEDLAVRQGCYDYAIDPLKAECEHLGLDVNLAFPEPPGMAQWRIDHPEPVLEGEQWHGRADEERAEMEGKQ